MSETSYDRIKEEKPKKHSPSMDFQQYTLLRTITFTSHLIPSNLSSPRPDTDSVGLLILCGFGPWGKACMSPCLAPSAFGAESVVIIRQWLLYPVSFLLQDTASSFFLLHVRFVVTVVIEFVFEIDFKVRTCQDEDCKLSSQGNK